MAASTFGTRQRISIADLVNDYDSSSLPSSSSSASLASPALPHRHQDNEENGSPRRPATQRAQPTPTRTPSPKARHLSQPTALWRQALLDPGEVSPFTARIVHVALPCGHARTVRAQYAKLPQWPLRIVLVVADKIICTVCGCKAGLEAASRLNSRGTMSVMTRAQVSHALCEGARPVAHFDGKTNKKGRRHEAALRRALADEQDQERLRRAWLENWERKRALLGDAEEIKRFFGERAVLGG